MYKALTERITNPEILEILSKGKEASVGFDRKVHINRQLLEDIRTADIRKTDYIPFADDLLIIHGTKDEIIPIEDSLAFCENNVIEFVPVQNADHRFTDPRTMEQATKHILEFFNL